MTHIQELGHLEVWDIAKPGGAMQNFAVSPEYRELPVVEIGVLAAETSKHLVKVSPEFWAIDSFEGLAKPGPSDNAERYPEGKFNNGGIGKYLESLVRKSGLSTTEIGKRMRPFKGWIPDVFDQCPEGQIQFAYADVDHYEPTLHAALWAYDRLCPGGTLVIDDVFLSRDDSASGAAKEFLRIRKIGSAVHRSNGDRQHRLIVRRSF